MKDGSDVLQKEKDEKYLRSIHMHTYMHVTVRSIEAAYTLCSLNTNVFI